MRFFIFFRSMSAGMVRAFVSRPSPTAATLVPLSEAPCGALDCCCSRFFIMLSVEGMTALARDRKSGADQPAPFGARTSRGKCSLCQTSFSRLFDCRWAHCARFNYDEEQNVSDERLPDFVNTAS